MEKSDYDNEVSHLFLCILKVVIDGEFVNLNMELTLEQNGIEDESEKFLELGMDEDFFIPTVHIYFSDDLTYAWGTFNSEETVRMMDILES